jgi:hypothetical protein
MKSAVRQEVQATEVSVRATKEFIKYINKYAIYFSLRAKEYLIFMN